MGTLLFTTSCDDDDPDPIDEGEVITTVTLSLVDDGKGQDAEATIRNTTGNNVQDAPLTLKANTTYNATITLSDESKTPAVDRTPEIRQNGNEHLFIYNYNSLTNDTDMNVQITDMDANNRPVGLEATVTTGANAGTGKLQVVLKHQPGGLKTGASIAGETDVEVDFDVIIQ
ncbi:hypothetical protein [uncultured Pontibacter sp.]|uniref:hypothetical protein n=1 Tax=uncultured Pontibacter sp. TaxID=453356 RepID=UPI002622590F|nr:hypothetical protein [uncultured Pontibacter sp.]